MWSWYSWKFQSLGGRVVKGALLPDQPAVPGVIPLPGSVQWISHPQPLVFLCLSISDFLTDPYIENIWKCRSQRAQSRSPCPSPPGSGYVLAVQWKATRSTDIFTAGTSYSFLAKGRGHQAPHVPSLFLGIFCIFFFQRPHLVAKPHQPETAGLQKGQRATELSPGKEFSLTREAV